MPNLYAHNLLIKRFSSKAEKIISRCAVKNDFAVSNYSFLAMGTQGPDPLFYMGILPSHGLHLPTALKKLGNKLHKKDGRKFIRLLCEESYRIEDAQERKKFQAFTFGQFAHYLLDRQCHAYIVYMTGFDDEGKITGKYHYAHAYFESQIDIALALKNNDTYFLSDPSGKVTFRKEELELVDRHLVPVLKTMFDENKLPKNMYSNGIRNMAWLQHFMNTKHGAFKAKLIGKNNIGAIHLDVKNADPSVLNEERRTYRNPTTGEQGNLTFMEMLRQANDILSRCYSDLLRQGFSYDVFTKYFNGMNYYGTPVDEKWVYKAENEKSDH